LIWAYDEAQTIHSIEAVAPKARLLFGNNINIGGDGGTIYPGGIRKAHDMERCYRTPGEILSAAYTLGLGLLRPQGVLKPDRLQKKDLQAIGFTVDGVLESNYYFKWEIFQHSSLRRGTSFTTSYLPPITQIITSI